MSAPVIPGLVSTILPVHNRPEWLRRAAQSVLDQTYRPVELIVVDDGSTDGTACVADGLAVAHPDMIRVVRRPNGGPGAARESGRLLARGEFIQYLDSDTELFPHKFEAQVAALAADPGAGIAYGWTAHSRPEVPIEGLSPWMRTAESLDWLFPALLVDRWWGTSTPLYRRSVTDAAGPWLNLRLNEDWEYDARIGAVGVRLVRVEEWVSREYAHDGPKLSGGTAGSDPAKLRERAAAHQFVFRHALRAGIGPEAPERRHFARAAFLLSRLCGVAGETESARACWKLAVEASGNRMPDLWLFRGVASVVGWSVASRAVAWMVERLGRRPGSHTLPVSRSRKAAP